MTKFEDQKLSVRSQEIEALQNEKSLLVAKVDLLEMRNENLKTSSHFVG